VSQPTWYVYIVQCRDNTLYTGISTNPETRVAEHNSGQNAAKYTRARRPVSLLYTEPAASRSAALKREIAIKRLSRQAKLALINEINS
jgi:putative endonuclease